jgi:hypothetical protein
MEHASLAGRRYVCAVSDEHWDAIDYGIGAAAREAPELSGLETQVAGACRAGELAYGIVIEWHCLPDAHQLARSR